MIIHGRYLVNEMFVETSFWHTDAVLRGIHLITYVDKFVIIYLYQ
jgi:hypothetical protein